MSEQTYTKKDFDSGLEVRWCPGCGDYAILAQVQGLLPTLPHKKEDYMFISGIGCSSRFPYYMGTYGFHTIHGRAPAFVSGARIINQQLSAWMITGDGDGLSIGGNHFLHILRRNIDANILLFDNRIYGLTKGQYSPTSETGTVTKSTPFGSIDNPVDPVQFALGANASFVARTTDRDLKHMREMLRLADEHRGTSLVHIMQNCIVFNDKIWDQYTDKKIKSDHVIYLEEEAPLVFGAESDKGIMQSGSDAPAVVSADSDQAQLLVHDSHSRTQAWNLAQLGHDATPIPLGVIYQEQRPVYEQELVAQEAAIQAEAAAPSLRELYESADSWEIS